MLVELYAQSVERLCDQFEIKVSIDFEQNQIINAVGKKYNLKPIEE